jgi:transcriptional regulator with XRE-family HTH domain
MKNLCTHRDRVVNLVGRQIRRLRCQRSWSQRALAIKLQLAGWDVDRSTVSKIEGGWIYVHDFQLIYLAEVLGVPLDTFFSQIDFKRPAHDTVTSLIRNEKRGLVPVSPVFTDGK